MGHPKCRSSTYGLTNAVNKHSRNTSGLAQRNLISSLSNWSWSVGGLLSHGDSGTQLPANLDLPYPLCNGAPSILLASGGGECGEDRKSPTWRRHVFSTLIPPARTSDMDAFHTNMNWEIQSLAGLLTLGDALWSGSEKVGEHLEGSWPSLLYQSSFHLSLLSPQHGGHVRDWDRAPLPRCF